MALGGNNYFFGMNPNVVRGGPEKPKDAETLEKAIEKLVGKEKSGPRVPRRMEFPTREFERRFKKCLASVPLDCHMETIDNLQVIALRPKNVSKFDEMVKTNGLANCEAAVVTVQWLMSNPDEYLRFVNH